MAGGTLISASTGILNITRGVTLLGAMSTFATSSSGSITLSGPITGTGDLRLAGPILLANTSSTYTGATNIEGTVRFAGDAVFGQSPVIAGSSSSATLRLIGDWVTSRIILGNNLALDDAGFYTTFNGPLRGSAAFYKDGTGVLTVTDASDFTGSMFVRGGTVRLAGAIGPSTFFDALTVAAAGRLEGSISSGRALTLSGTLAPGLGIGTIETGNLTLAGSSRLELQVASNESFDQLRVNGTVTFSGLVQLAITNINNFALSAPWPIVLNDGTDAITTTSTKAFAIGSTVLTEGSSFFIGSQQVHITYAGGDGNDIYLDVPEPATSSLLTLSALAMFGRWRRQTARR